MVLSRYVRERFAQLHVDGWRTYPTKDSAQPDLALAAESRVLPVFDAFHQHPAFPDGVNYMFRAVHDVYGHLATDPPAPFGLAGEVLSAAQQARDLDSWFNGQDRKALRFMVQAALWTEIVGQAAYYEVRGRFPVQKAVLLDRDALVRA
jgi:hypothetical protein